MAAQVILVEAQPRRAADGVAETVRLAGGGGSLPYYYDGQHWKAGIKGLPTITTELKFEGGDFGTGSVPSVTAIEWAPATNAALAAMAAYVWTDAPITVRIGPEGTLPPVAISGKVMEAPAEDGVLRITLADPAADLKKPLLTSRYAGTGGLEGPAEWAGVIKPRLWGRVWNRRGDPIDKANSIYCFADPTKRLQAFDAVRDKGAPAAALALLSWQGSAAATFAALQAATAPQGGGVIAPSIACVKWWTQPAGDLTADIKGEIGSGYVETSAQIAERLVQEIAGPAFAAGTVAAAAAARPAPVGWSATSDNVVVTAMLDELLGNVSLLWLLDATGKIVIRPWVWGASVASAKAIDVSRKAAFRPLATRKIGYRRNELPMARGDLAGIVLAGDVTYADGTPVEALKPAEAGATVGMTDGEAAVLAQIDAAATAPSVTVSNPAITLWAYENGLVADFSKANGQLKVWSGGVDVTASATLSATPDANCEGTINTAANTPVTGQPKGYYRVTALSANNAALTLTAVYGGKTIPVVVPLTKLRGGYEIVASTLPTTNLFDGRLVFRESDGKLYRYVTGPGWTAAVNGADIVNASIDTAKFASGIEPIGIVTGATVPTVKTTTTIYLIGTAKLYRWNGIAYVASVAADDVTGTLTNAQIQSLAAAKLTGQITGTQVGDSAITTPKIAAAAVETANLAASAVTADKVAAKSMTVDKLVIGTATNMIPNSNFETLNGWYSYGGAGYSVTPYVGTEGSGLRIKKGSGTVEVGARMNGFASADPKHYLPVSPGEAYRVKCKVKRLAGTNAANVGLYGDLLKTDGTRLGTQIGGIASSTPTGTLVEVSGTYTIPADAVGIMFQVYYGNDAASANGEVLVTDMSVTRMAAGELIVDGAVTANSLAADAVVAGKIAAAAVNAREIAAGAISVNKLAVIPEGLVPDPYFYDNTYWLFDASGWGAYNATGGTVADQMGVPRTAYLDPVGSRRHIWTPFIPFGGRGQTYRLRAVCRNNTSTVAQVDIQIYDSSGAFVGGGGLSWPAGAAVSEKSALITVPNSAASYRIVVYNNGAFSTSGQRMYVSGVKLDVAASAELIVDGEVKTNHLAALAVTTDKLNAGAVTAAKMSVTQLAAITAITGNLDVTGRILVDTGSYIKAIGDGFGTSNQFIEWYGPKMALSLCSEGNAVSYVKTNGDAYFGGALSTGTFKNSITGTLLTSPAETILGPFSTNGNTKVVNVSVSLAFNQSYTYGGTVNPTTTPTIRATLYRSRDGSSWTQLRQDTFTGSYSHQAAQPTEPGRLIGGLTGSYTYTDTGGTGTSPMYYRIVLDNRGLPGINGSQVGLNSQRATIVSTEG